MQETIKTITFPKGSIIFETHSPANHVYVLKKGELGVRYGNNPEVEVGVIRPGESFGESALLAGSKRSATVSCLSETVVLAFDSSNFQSLFKQWPEGKIMCQCVLIEMLNANEKLWKKSSTELHRLDSHCLTVLVDNVIKSTRTLARTLRSEDELVSGWKKNRAFLITGGRATLSHGDQKTTVGSDWSLGASELITGSRPESIFSIDKINDPLSGWFVEVSEPFERLSDKNKGLAAIIRGIAYKKIRTNELAQGSNS